MWDINLRNTSAQCRCYRKTNLWKNVVIAGKSVQNERTDIQNASAPGAIVPGMEMNYMRVCTPLENRESGAESIPPYMYLSSLLCHCHRAPRYAITRVLRREARTSNRSASAHRGTEVGGSSINPKPDTPTCRRWTLLVLLLSALIN